MDEQYSSLLKVYVGLIAAREGVRRAGRPALAEQFENMFASVSAEIDPAYRRDIEQAVLLAADVAEVSENPEKYRAMFERVMRDQGAAPPPGGQPLTEAECAELRNTPYAPLGATLPGLPPRTPEQDAVARVAARGKAWSPLETPEDAAAADALVRAEMFAHTYRTLRFARLQLAADEEPQLLAYLDETIRRAGERLTPDTLASAEQGAEFFASTLTDSPIGRLQTAHVCVPSLAPAPDPFSHLVEAGPDATCSARSCDRRRGPREDGWMRVLEPGRIELVLCPAHATQAMHVVRALVAPAGVAS